MKEKGKLFIISGSSGVGKTTLLSRYIGEEFIPSLPCTIYADFKIKSIHDDFKTVKVIIENEEIDIASTRTEAYPMMGCLPVIKEVGVKIEEDLKRRDFTVNAIALNISTGEIIDVFNGKEDIEKKILKILHNRSFIDDPTRILRGLDFKYRFGFEFEEETKNLALKCTKDYNNESLSIDRIYLTLNKIFQNIDADKILKDIIENNIYKIWTKKVGIELKDIQHLQNATELFEIKEKNKLFIMALENCPYVKVSFKDDFEIYQFFKKFNEIQLAFYYFKTGDESPIKYLKIKDIKPYINGKILIEKGFSEGENIGIILNSVLREKILNPDRFSSVENELNFVFQNFMP